MGSLDMATLCGFICRLCSERRRVVLHLYGEVCLQLGVSEKIRRYLSVEILPDDELPKTICYTCLQRLEEQHELMVKASDTMKNLSVLPRPSEVAYAKWTTLRHRGKIIKMVIELVTDVKMKIKSIQYMRSMFHDDINYQVGEIMYDIRKKFKRMVYLTQSSDDLDKNKKIKNLVECQQLNMDLDKLINTIEDFEWSVAKRSHAHDRFKFILRTKEQNAQETQKKKDILRAQMKKIMNSERQVTKKQRPMEDGFYTY